MRPKTIFLDIDGTILKHHGSMSKCVSMPPALLDNVHQKLDEWDRKSYRVILVTGRKESMRKMTEKQLRRLGINYDMLVMQVGNGPRVLINDTGYEGEETAFGITVERNKGLGDVDV